LDSACCARVCTAAATAARAGSGFGLYKFVITEGKYIV
jgi:hypothetical protein